MFFGYIIALFFNIMCMLMITMVMAALTVMERKVLSLCQRRVGPNFVGYRGRLQYMADAMKMFVKGIIMPHKANKVWFVAMPSMAGAVCYTFWINSVWGPNISIFEIEYNIVYAALLSILFGYCIILTGYFSKSKYAFMASMRAVILTMNLEMFLGLMNVNLLFFVESFNFVNFVFWQENIWFSIMFFGVMGLVIMVFLLETNSAPFDLVEAESELVAGYSTEYGGFFFALYYLGEYFHLFFFSMYISIVLFGGWENFLMLNIFFDYNYLIF